ncbi:BZ3500_MvSof-1268-A1-R1_Chr8-1g09954 [Microbotryum saponariae]|uniref:BZ3500_MvSof-1268-A1-R1_Chr8-1g09954 protein n=1 Tax=Microbotryum saponariae TaxID=289078 RepID=A0A2X0LRM6_9BASI|nr:BZ3500_MvSof-1268-A1-R1_Chr8-1g09954 [Microbotryum saponariae]SDA08240.1 BZ3501_MvSof-1269-A2-R1_Chr8-1g09677 [Microbotryum saponariae]
MQSISNEKSDLEDNISHSKELEAVTVDNRESQGTVPVAGDAVFGVNADGPNYLNVGWIRAAVFLMKAQIGLGVLGIPQVMSTVGLFPGLFLIIILGVMTIWSAYVVGVFKQRHPECHSIADAGFVLGGRVGREALGIMCSLFMLCVCASGLLSISIAFNALSSHGACTVGFVIVGGVIVYILASIRTIDKLSFLSWVGLASVLSALFTLAVAVGVEDRPAAAPPTGPWSKNLRLFGNPSFADASSSIGTLVFAFSGAPAYFTVFSEMREPKDFPKTIALCQSVITTVFILLGVIVWFFCGQYVASPALGSAGAVMKKVCYGLALPSLIIGFVSPLFAVFARTGFAATDPSAPRRSVIYLHLTAKYFFVRALRGGPHLNSNSSTHWITWLSLMLGCVTFAFFVAEAIPVFGGLIGLIGALFGSLMSMHVMGAMWFYDNFGRRHEDKSWRFRALVAWNVYLIAAGTFIMISGSYASIKSIIDDYAGKTLSVFSCADNSQ